MQISQYCFYIMGISALAASSSATTARNSGISASIERASRFRKAFRAALQIGRHHILSMATSRAKCHFSIGGTIAGRRVVLTLRTEDTVSFLRPTIYLGGGPAPMPPGPIRPRDARGRSASATGAAVRLNWKDTASCARSRPHARVRCGGSRPPSPHQRCVHPA